jgi:DNA polymerase-3 subunit gamma/tau
MLLVRLARRPPLLPLDELVQRLDTLERRLSGRGGGGPPNQRPPGRPEPERSFQGAARPREQRSAPTPRPAADDDRGEPPRVAAAPERSFEARGEQPRSKPPSAKDGPDFANFAFPEPQLAVAPARSETPAPVAGPPAPVPEGIETFRAIVDRLGESRPEIAAFLAQAALLSLGPPVLVLAYPKEDAFAREVEQNVALIRAAAEATLGAEVKVTIERDDALARSFRTLARLDAEAEEGRRRAAIAKARSHPRIAEAIEVLGARLKDLKLADG